MSLKPITKKDMIGVLNKILKARVQRYHRQLALNENKHQKSSLQKEVI